MPFIQHALIAGEISPELFGRVDIAKWHVAASTARNFQVNYRGGAASRAGTMFVGFSKQTGRTVPPRLIPFQFSINQGLALEFGNLYMRVISNGAFVTETPINISGISNTNPAEVTVSVLADGYNNGDWVYLANVLGMTELNGRTLVIKGAMATTFFLTDVYGNNIDATAYGAYAGGGTVARIFTLVTPWAEADLEYLKFTQSADVMSLCCWNQLTGTEYAPYDLERIADDNWTLTAPTFSSPIAAPGGLIFTPTVNTPLYATASYGYTVTAVDAVTGAESVAAAPVYGINADLALYNGSNDIVWDAVAGASSYNVYRAEPFNAPGTAPYIPIGSLYGYIGTALGLEFTDTNIVSDFSQVPPVHNNPFAPGAIIDVPITAQGAGYVQATVGYSITTSTGSGFVGVPIVTNGSVTGFLIEDSGMDYADTDTITISGGATFATGYIAFTVNPSASDTVTLNGVTWTFVSSSPGLDQTLIGTSLNATLSQLASDLANSKKASLTVAGYSAGSGNGQLNITYDTPGTAGNAYTLAASAATPSAGTLTGGSSGGTGSGATATLTIGPQTGTYPSDVTYFQERRIYAASPNNPDTYWMSQPGAFLNYDSRIPTIDDDAITGSPWSLEVNGIQAMIPMPGGLVVLTGLSAWQLTGAGGSSLNPQPITPANQQAQPQAYNGCSQTVPPQRIDYDILYVQAKGSIVRDLSYNFFVNIYTGADLTILSSQLFTGYTIKEWAWTEEPYKILWGVRNDGILLSLTYLKPQDITGWARHDTNGSFESVCSVTEPPVDALYCATQRFPGMNTAYMIERMNNRIWQTIDDAWCVDAGLALAQPQPQAILTVSSATGLGSITGATGLIGGQNYSALTKAVVVDDNNQGPGTGAVPNITIVGGSIASVTFPLAHQGQDYTYPRIDFLDPARTGTGASAQAVLNNSANFIASAGVFSAGSVGSVIRGGGGIAIITAYVSPTEVVGNIISPIVGTFANSGGNVVPLQPGEWTLTAPTNIVTGLDHLAGAEVVGLADGNIVGPLLVAADGSVTLPFAASSIVLGLGFQCQLQSIYLDAGQPTVIGQRKKISAVTLLLYQTRDIEVGTNQPDGSTLSPPQIAPEWNSLSVVPNNLNNTNTPPYGSTIYPLYTGMWRLTTKGGFEKPGQIAVQQSNPVPCTILAMSIEAFPGDEPQVKVTERAPQGQAQQRRAA